MRTRPATEAGARGGSRGSGGALFGLAIASFVAACAAAAAAAGGQVAYEQAIADLGSADAGVRLRTVESLKRAAYLDAAVPLAKAVLDAADSVQLEAIGAELNIFLADPIVPRKRVGFLVEVRTPVAADAVFAAGPLAIGPRTVPIEVLDALRTASRDDNPRVRLEALYAFGVLAVEPGGNRRRELLRTAGPDLAAMIGAVDPAHRYAAIRVIGRVFAHRPRDPALEELVGDAVVGVLNDTDPAMRTAAMQTLGAMRYERAVQALTDLFHYYGKGDMALAALDALARIAHPSSVPLLASQLMAKSAPVRLAAIEGLARAGDRASRPAVEEALRGERSASLQLAGSFASALLGGASGNGMASIVEALARPPVREQARAYLVDAMVGTTPAIGRYLQDPDPGVRADLVDALGLSGDPRALALVQPLATDPDVRVAQAVERAAARLRQVGR